MATREELLALLTSRRRGLSIRPAAVGPTAVWQQWLSDESRLRVARGPARIELIAATALKPLRPLPRAHAPQGRWARFRGLFRQGWGREREELPKLRYGAFATSVLLNVFFAAMLLWLTYLQFLAVQAPAEETVRIRITGFGTVTETGGGEASAEGDLQAQSASAAQAQGEANAVAATPPVEAAAEAASNEVPAEMQDSTAEAAIDQPLQVTESLSQADGFQLPPTREVAIQTPVLQPREVPTETEIPRALPQVHDVQLPTTSQSVRVQAINIPQRELPTAPEPSPQVRIREVAARPLGAEVRVAETSTRALPSAPDASTSAAQATDSPASGRAAATPKPGLPGATAQSPKPGQQAASAGVGQSTRASDSGWSSPRRSDDWGLGDRSRAGSATGGDRGNPAGAGGSGLYDADGRPRLADDSFKAKFPDPYKEGTWLKRPSLGYRGTMFDGIWRPPETLLQEWIRKGVKTVDIPLPGGKVKIRCVVSLLQFGGGCGPVAGKEGVHDEPARARAAPAVPFKRELFENQGDLSPAKPASQDASSDDKPNP